jgi:hypothetical protein
MKVGKFIKYLYGAMMKTQSMNRDQVIHQKLCPFSAVTTYATHPMTTHNRHVCLFLLRILGIFKFEIKMDSTFFLLAILGHHCVLFLMIACWCFRIILVIPVVLTALVLVPEVVLSICYLFVVVHCHISIGLFVVVNSPRVAIVFDVSVEN